MIVYNKVCRLLVMDLADRLRQRRKFLKLTQAQLAEKAGMTQQTVQQIETRKVLSTGRIIDLAVALGVRPAWLEAGKEPMVEALTPKDMEFLAAYHTLPSQEQAAVRTLVFRGRPVDQTQAPNLERRTG
ncbi:MAG: helix-turn-helix transcriptional regulator [Candidatus Competibacteraceae bacterium]|nr:helix-turn-helix transcriptional regulator [Candidatus Competibacteraceae bacterium]